MVVMGVAGCGKSSVGMALSEMTGIAYRDGDDLHPETNVAKMRAGTPLTDEDRWPWLDRVAGVLAKDAPVIVGCSALRRAYRDRLRAGAGGAVQFVHLVGTKELIASRIGKREGHYMPLTLLESQFAALEVPDRDERALCVSIDAPLNVIVATILAALPEAE